MTCWRVIGPTWTLPATTLSASGDVLLVQPAAIPWLKAQRIALEAFLASKAYKQAQGAFWLVRNELAKFAIPFDGDPEDAVSWVPVPKEEVKVEDFQGMDLFFQSLSAAGWGSVGALKTLYIVFCRALMEQLVLRKQSVDLGFCRLHSIPFRANWRQVLMELDMDSTSTERVQKAIGVAKRSWKTRRLCPPVQMAAMLKRGLPEMLLDAHLQGVKDLDLARTIEVELKPMFKKALYENERQRVKLGKLRRAADEILAKQNQILVLYAAFVEASALPYVLFPEGKLAKSGSGLWTGDTRESHAPYDLPVAYGLSGEEKSVEANLVDEDAGLPPLPELLSQGPDVRSENQDLDEIPLCATSG